jgi:membrane protein
MDKQSPSFKVFLKEIYKNITEHNIAMHAATIAFYSIFSAAPLMYIIITLTAHFGSPQTMQILNQYLNQLMGHNLAQPLIEMANATHHQHTSFFTSALSIITLAIGATTAIIQMQSSLDTIWDAPESEVNSILLLVIDRIISVVVIFALLIVLFASMLLESNMRLLGNSSHSFLPAIFNAPLNFLPDLIFVLCCLMFFTIIFKLLPDVKARWRDVLVGACLTTFLFFVGKYLIGIYLNHSSLQSTYKTSGSFIIFLIWIYYNAQVVLIGAVFTAVYTQLYGGDIDTSPQAKLIHW